MIYTTKKKIRKIFRDAPKKKVDEFYSTFKEFANRFNIRTEVHENFILAQIVAETGYALDAGRENLNYSCKSLKNTFSKYRNNPDWADRDGRCNNHKANQVNIGNIAYANRIGNGNISSGDGYRFRGGGYFQLTGRSNYKNMADVIQRTIGDAIGANGIEKGITEPRIGLLTAMAFWVANKCYDCSHIDCITKKINRYTDTYTKRKEIYQWIAML